MWKCVLEGKIHKKYSWLWGASWEAAVHPKCPSELTVFYRSPITSNCREGPYVVYVDADRAAWGGSIRRNLQRPAHNVLEFIELSFIPNYFN